MSALPPQTVGGSASVSTPAQRQVGGDEEDRSQHTIIAEGNFRRVRDRRTLKLYRSILSKSYLPQKHMDFIADLYASDRMPMGRVSLQQYERIFEARAFDRYGKMVANKLTGKEKMIKDLQANLTAQAVSSSDTPAAPNGSSTPHPPSSAELRTPLWKIGYKPPVHGPPGLAPPLPYVLNSEGNERYYSYDGDWVKGRLCGGGT